MGLPFLRLHCLLKVQGQILQAPWNAQSSESSELSTEISVSLTILSHPLASNSDRSFNLLLAHPPFRIHSIQNLALQGLPILIIAMPPKGGEALRQQVEEWTLEGQTVQLKMLQPEAERDLEIRTCEERSPLFLLKLFHSCYKLNRESDLEIGAPDRPSRMAGQRSSAHLIGCTNSNQDMSPFAQDFNFRFQLDFP